MDRTRWQDWLILLVGFALAAVPYLFSYTLPEGLSSALVTTAFVVSGLVALFLGTVGVATDQSWEEWLTALLGAWLVGMPWILGFETSRVLMWSSLGAGLILVVLAGLSLRQILAEHA